MKNTKLLVLVLLIVAFIAGTFTFWDILTTFLLAAIFAYLLTPLTNFVVRKANIKRGAAVAIVFFAFVVLIAFLISVTVPAAIRQITNLITEIQKYANNLDLYIDRLIKVMENMHIPQEGINMVHDLLGNIDSYFLTFFRALLTTILDMSMHLFDGVIFVILVVYFLLDGKKLIDTAVEALPKGPGLKVRMLITRSNNLSWKYLRTRCIISGGMALVVFIGLNLMGIQYAVLFAIISFALDFIPYFGSLLAGIIETFYALITGSLPLAVGVAIFILVVQQIEGNIVAPRMEGDATGIHPIFVMFSLMACSQVWGLFGMLISVPLAAILKLVYVELYHFVISPDEEELVPAAVEVDD